MQWGYNINNYDVWQCEWFDTKEEAIQAAKDEIEECELEKEQFKVGQLHKHVPSVDFDTLIEHAVEWAYDECGEVAESWLNPKYMDKEIIDKYQQKLSDLFKEFLVEANEVPSFGRIVNVVTVKVNQN